MADAGHTHLFDIPYNNPCATLVYQVYKEIPGEETQYCEPRIEGDLKLDEMRRTLALVESVANKVESMRAKAVFAKRVKDCTVYGTVNDFKREPSSYSLESLVEVIAALQAMGGVEIETFTRYEGNQYPFTELVPKRG